MDLQVDKKVGGGICIYTRKDIIITEVKALSVSNEDVEILPLVLQIGRHKKIKLCTVYRPPNGNCEQALNHMRDILDNLSCLYSGEVLLIGDFNIDLSVPSRSQSRKLKVLADSRYLTQIINCHTHITAKSETSIDHISRTWHMSTDLAY